MTTIAIVSCRIFEDELTHLMKKAQREKTRLLLIETEFIESIEKKFKSERIDYEKISENDIEGKLKDSADIELTIILQMIEFSMEARPSEIKDVVYDKIKMLQSDVDGIMVLYGLCGNVLGNIESDLSLENCPVRILRDEEGEIADDCICVALGGRKKYAQILKNSGGEGTYFLTPMQAAYWREIAYASMLTPDPNDDDMIKMVFDYSNYKNVGKISTGLCYEKGFDETVDDFAKRFEFNIIEYEGSNSIIENFYDKFLKEIKK